MRQNSSISNNSSIWRPRSQCSLSSLILYFRGRERREDRWIHLGEVPLQAGSLYPQVA